MEKNKLLKILFLSFCFWQSPLFASLPEEEQAANTLKSSLDQMVKLPTIGTIDQPCLTDEEIESPLPGLSEGFSENGADCSAFIKSNGERGNLGNIIRNYIRTNPDKEVYLGQSLEGMGPPQNICPNWKNLSQPEKEHFWIWTFAAISWKESTCNPKARNGNATNGVAVGLLQLDERSKNRAWRGPNCKTKSVSQSEDNVRCGLDIMTELLKADEGDYRSNGLLYGKKNNSYWQDLKKGTGGTIGELIRSYPPCQMK